jgi:hypothetical protein
MGRRPRGVSRRTYAELAPRRPAASGQSGQAGGAARLRQATMRLRGSSNEQGALPEREAWRRWPRAYLACTLHPVVLKRAGVL